MMKYPWLKMFSVRTCMSLQTFDRSPVDNISSRKPSQKAAYMADTPTRVRKDHLAQRYVFFSVSALPLVICIV
jgi:hypothetical protein